jgi:capsular polysaccharide biosynthesis protein
MPGKAGTNHSVHRYLAAFARWFWLAGLCVVVGAAGTFVMTEIQTPVYRATTILFIGQQSASVPLVDTQLVTTYAQLISQPVVLSEAARQVGGITPTDLARHVQASAESNTSLLDVSVDDPDPNRAASLANAVAGAFISEISRQVITAAYPVAVFQPAAPPATPDHPKPLLNTLVGGAFGLAIAVVLVHLLNLLEKRTYPAQPAGNKTSLNGNHENASEDLADVTTAAD